MPLSKGQIERLLDAGFLPFEVKQVHRAKTPDGVTYQSVDLTGATWKATIESRRRWVQSRLDNDWSKEEIRKTIIKFYRRRGYGRDIWSFLKLEYKPVKRISDFAWALKLRARKRISWQLGADYGRHMYPQKRPMRR